MKVIYTGVFFDTEEFYESIKDYEKRLSRTIVHPHVTYEYRPWPNRVRPDLFGTPVTVIVKGYKRGKSNEGFLVSSLECDNRELEQMLSEILVPHITISVSKNGKPVNTVELPFKKCEQRVFHGRYGAFCTDGQVHFDPEALEPI